MFPDLAGGLPALASPFLENIVQVLSKALSRKDFTLGSIPGA